LDDLRDLGRSDAFIAAAPDPLGTREAAKHKAMLIQQWNARRPSDCPVGLSQERT